MSDYQHSKSVEESEYGHSKVVSPEIEPQPAQPTVAGSAQAFGRTFGRGITAGLTDYPAALAMMGTRALTGAAGPQNTYEQALADVRAGQREAKQMYPVASAAGEVGGAVLGTGLLGGATSLPRLVGTSAGLGAVSGFTGREGMENVVADVATGAGIGGTLGLLGAGAVKALGPAQEKLVKNVYMNNQQRFAEKYDVLAQSNLAQPQPAYQRVMTRLSMTAPSKRPEINDQTILNIIKENNTSKMMFTPAEQKLAKDALENMRIAEARRANITEAKNLSGKELFEKVGKSTEKEAERQTTGVFKAAKQFAPMVAAGGIGGAGLGTLTGIGPVAGAQLGAGLGGLYQLRELATPAVMQSFAAMASKSPNALAEPIGYATQAAARGSVPFVLPAVAPQSVPEPAPIDTRARLQSLADQFRAKFGTQ